MNMNRPAGMSTTGVSSDVSSRGYGDQIAAHYRVKEALSPEIELKLEEVGEQRVRKLIRWVNDEDEAANASGSVAPMKLMQEKENYRIYEQQNEQEKLLVMKGVLLLQSSSCGEVMELLSGKNGSDVQDFLTDIFAAQYGDSAILHYVDMGATQQQKHKQQNNHSSRDLRSSSVSSATAPSSTTMLFQWLALKDASPALPLRDYLFMRFNQTFPSDDPASSHKVAYGASVWESIEIPSCRPIFSAQQMTRKRFKNCGYVVESSDETDAVRVTFFITMPLDQATLQSDRAWLVRMAGSVRLLPSALVNLRIKQNQLVDKSKWDSRDTCALCTSSFTLMKRAHHCRICGTSVCSKCCSVRRDTRSRHSSSGIRVCLSCLNGEDTSALWGASMGKKHLGSKHTSHNSSSSSSLASSRDQHQAQRSRDSNTSKESWSSRDLERSRTSYQSSVESFSSSSRSFDDLSADADASAALASLRIRPAIIEDRDEDDVLANTSYDYSLTFHKGTPWPDAPIPATEKERLERIRTLNLSQQYAKSTLKELLDLARTSINCPVATVAVITASTCLLVTSVGLAGDQLPRDMALESHVIMSSEPFVILDALQDERFARNPLVAQLHIRFYIGLPLVMQDGVVVGSLSLGDVSPRDKVKGSDLRSLKRIAARIVDKMEGTATNNNNLGMSGVHGMSHHGATTSSATAPIGGMLLL